jgi:hypothetical protein
MPRKRADFAPVKGWSSCTLPDSVTLPVISIALIGVYGLEDDSYLTGHFSFHEWKRSFCAMMSAIALQMPTDWTLSSIKQFSATMPHLKESTTVLAAWLADEDVIKPATRLGQSYQGQSAFGEAEE